MKIVIPGGSGQVGTLLGKALVTDVTRSWSSAAMVGAVFLRTETELILKSRRVVPGRLLDAGFTFRRPTWPEAACDLGDQWRRLHGA